MISRNTFHILGVIFLIWVSYSTYTENTGTLYGEYKKLWEYRRLHPDFLPNTAVAKLTSAGHTTTYADVIWINMVQYIGDNAASGKYKIFMNPLIQTITSLHPYFTSPYNLALVLSPILNADKPSYEADKKISTEALRIWESGMKLLCDQGRVEQILKNDFWNTLWNNPTLKNPCKDSMLPYNMAYTSSELWEIDSAEWYYKIASTSSGAPLASRFLGPLMRAREWDHRESAERFALIAIDGYDEAPYTCHTLAIETLTDLKQSPLRSLVKILPLRESKLAAPKDTKNPLSISPTNCHDSMKRAMKQVYLAYITEIWEKYPKITTGKWLIDAWLISTIPSLEQQKWWDLVRGKDSIWKYQFPSSEIPKK